MAADDSVLAMWCCAGGERAPLCYCLRSAQQRRTGKACRLKVCSSQFAPPESYLAGKRCVTLLIAAMLTPQLRRAAELALDIAQTHLKRHGPASPEFEEAIRVRAGQTCSPMAPQPAGACPDCSMRMPSG